MRNWIHRMSLPRKLSWLFVLVGALPLATAIGIAYLELSNAINQEAREKLTLVGNDKAQEIAEYFNVTANSIIDMASSPSTEVALQELDAAFAHISDEPAAGQAKAVAGFFSDVFAKAYREKSGKETSALAITRRLDALATAAQYEYIVENPNPLGKKDELLTPPRKSAYNEAHARHHAHFRSFISRYGLYDLFLINPEGRIIYTVFKEADFATSLKQGPWSDSGLARAFEKSKQLEFGKVVLEDFAPYTPSYEAPASFLGTPLFRNGKYVGSLIVQLPLDRISAVANNREGLGEQGETTLVGADLKLRADSIRNKEKYTVAASFDGKNLISVASEALANARAGKTGIHQGGSYDGLPVLAFHRPLEIQGLQWYLVTELSEEEVFAQLRLMTLHLLTLLVIGAIVIFVISLYFGRSIGNALMDIARRLGSSCERISLTSQQIAGSSQQLSAAATEQAASLEETAASLNEISSMVAKSTENAANMATSSADSERQATRGRDVIERMVTTMSGINESNDAIMKEVQSGHERLAEIVKVIQEIGAKTKVINEIVFQTKLLSFNASVEAARAGEHGKGFAIVADEVGNLAKMSGSAAKEIGDLLEGSLARVESITKDTQASVEKMILNGKDRVEEGLEVARECATVLGDIAGNVTRVASLAQEVSSASTEQAQGVEEINKAIGQIDAATQQNAAAGEASSTSARELSEQAVNLQEVVESLLATIEGARAPVEETTHENVIAFNRAS